jgi:hypothetical protein
MPTDIETIKEIAKGSLMPDFFGVRVDEEGLWSPLRQLLTGLKLAAPNAAIDRIKRIASEATTASDFIEKVKAANLWMAVKELVQRVQVK